MVTIIFLQDPNLSWMRRTLHGRYFFSQATPKSGFLDPNWNRSVPIWPGMVAMRTLGVYYAEPAAGGIFAPVWTSTQAYTAGTVVGNGTEGQYWSALSDNTGEALPAAGASNTYWGWYTDVVTPPSMAQTGFYTGAEQAYTLINQTGVPYGLFGNFVGGDGVDELLMSGVNATAVWTLGPNAEFSVDAPAFDASLPWSAASSSNGTDVFVYARTANQSLVQGLNGMGGPYGTYGMRGQLIIPNTVYPNETQADVGVAGTNISSEPVGVLLGVESPTSLILGGLPVRYAPAALGGTGATVA